MIKIDEQKRLTRLIAFRSVASIVVLSASAYFFYSSFSPFERQLFSLVLAVSIGGLIFDWYLSRSQIDYPIQLFIQFSVDLIGIAVLSYLTGGMQSPFVFLFGLMIVAVGTLSHIMVVLMVTIEACICYLTAIYSYSHWHEMIISPSEGLHILLQTSALFLVGGVMAAIARRHASLQLETRQVERQHRRLQELHEQVVSSMQEGIIILDETFHIQDSNEAARQMFPMSRSLSWLKLNEVPEVPTELLDYLTRPDRSLFQCEWKTTTGLSLVIATLLPGDDPTAKWLLTLIDISNVRKLERQLAEQEKLAAMGRMVAMLAHEVRNPLNTIGQSVELMSSVAITKQGEIQKIVSEEINRLNRLVSDMLDFVQPLRSESVDVSAPDLVGSSVDQVDMAGEHGIEWQSRIDRFVVDPDHFRLVLDNLLRNAIEASGEPKSVQILLEDNSEFWELKISDQGGGISSTMKSQLFEPFASGRPKGIGLGLATVWQVCRANDWSVEVNDIPGGSEFVIRGLIDQKPAREAANG